MNNIIKKLNNRNELLPFALEREKAEYICGEDTALTHH